MKKSLYVAAALVALVGCTKEDNLVGTEEGAAGLTLSVGVENASTKAVFDGVDALKFESKDKLGAAIASVDEPNKIIKVASSDGGAATKYGATLTIVDPEADVPVFKGGFWDVVEAEFADKFNVYTYFPADAFNTGEDPSYWSATVKTNQKGYAGYWDPESDALVGVPGVVYTADAKYYSNWKEYSFERSVKTELAHMFGFGKLAFADIPEGYLEYEVNDVTIEAVGSNKALAGGMRVDISKSLSSQELTAGTTYSTITVTPVETVKVKDLVVWFVALPGDFDVKVSVHTFRGDLEFERSGLSIKRGKIAAPTVHFKESDTAVSHDVVLTTRQNWVKDNFNTGYISSSYPAPYWGPSDAQMAFSLAYPGSANSNYGSTLASTEDYYVKRQLLAYQNILGGKVVLYSRASFHNVEMVKIGLGIYTDDEPSCDYTVALVNGADTTVLKKIQYKGNVLKSPEYDLYYIENTTEVKDGDLVVIVDNLSSQDIKPMLGLLTLNPKPELSIATTSISVEKEAASGEIECAAHATDVTPKVESSVDWITVSYADGKIVYSIAANDGAKRRGTITASMEDGEYTDTVTVNVTQKSAIAQEFLLTVTPADMKPFADAVLEEKPTATASMVTGTLTAVATNGSGKTVDVDFSADYIMLKDLTDEYFKLRYDFKTTSPVGVIEKVVVSSSSSLGNSAYGLHVGLSATGSGTSSYKVQTNYTVEGSSPFVSTVTNDNEDYVYFKVGTGYVYTPIYKIEVYFISD